ncbi:MAG: biotin--[acetyl-CoA-carboxylase] ligase [Cocleimonas sp.]
MSKNYKPLDTDRISCDDDIDIHYFEELDSTNNWLKNNGDCGDVCICESQSEGRGRRGNSWQSPNIGNIYFSMCWCLDEQIKFHSLIGLIAGIATAEALTDCGVSGHGLKWPNDIYWQSKKLGGILIERSNQSERLIIGIGLNISLTESVKDLVGQECISIDEILGENEISREILLSHLIYRLANHLKQLKSLKFDDFIGLWDNWDILRGKDVSFIHQGGKVSGIVDQLDEFGRLGIIKNNGSLEYFSSADIKLENNLHK